MSLTIITAAFLRKAEACKKGVAWYRAHPDIHDWPWEVVCSVLEADGQWAWSLWVRDAVARLGTAEDRAVLRNDPSVCVRGAVAIHGSAEDRAALRRDPDVWVRRVVAEYGRSDPK